MVESEGPDGIVRQVSDRLNNQETVHIEEPSAGTHTIVVRGYTVPQGPQCFAMAITGNFVDKGQASAECPGEILACVGCLLVCSCTSRQCKCESFRAHKVLTCVLCMNVACACALGDSASVKSFVLASR